MNNKATSTAIPFNQFGNRQYLTGEQLAESPELQAFVDRFPDCFEQDRDWDFYWFYPEDNKPTKEEGEK